MKKTKKLSSFTSKFFIGTLALSLTATAVIVPIQSNYSQKQINKLNAENTDSNSRVLKNSDTLEKIINSNNTEESLKDQILYFNENFDSNTQRSFFQDVSNDQIFDQVSSILGTSNNLLLKKEIVSNNKKVTVKEQKEILKNIVDQIKSGDLSPSEILEKQKQFADQNKDEYKKFIDNIFVNDLDTKLDLNFKNKENLPKNINNSFVLKNSILKSKKNNNPEVNVISIDKNEYNFILNVEKEKNRLVTYENKNYGFAIASATLTAAAWAIAAFYWAAWWMFGANVPFAISASIQAGVMTYFTNESWNNYYETKNARIQMEQYINSEDYKNSKEAIEFLINSNSVKKSMSKSTINFIISTLVPNTTYPKLIKYLVKKIVSKPIEKILSGTYKILFKLFKNTLLKIQAYLGKLAAKKTIVMSTSWASPGASTVILILDTILSIFDFAGDIVLYHMYN